MIQVITWRADQITETIWGGGLCVQKDSVLKEPPVLQDLDKRE